MQANGTLFLGRAKPVATTAADGTFQLTLLAMDRIGPQQVEPWRILFAGEPAQAFWSQHAADLVPGAPVAITAERVRSFAQGRCSPEIHARAVQLSLAKHP